MLRPTSMKIIKYPHYTILCLTAYNSVGCDSSQKILRIYAMMSIMTAKFHCNLSKMGEDVCLIICDTD